MRALVRWSWALLLLAGCEVLAPVVGTRDGGMPVAMCLDLGGCGEPLVAQPAAPPRDRLALPTATCADPEIVHLTESAALEVEVGACIEVRVDGPSDAQEIVLTIDGDLRSVHLTVIAERKTTLRLGTLEASALMVTGEVDVVLDGRLTSAIVQLSRARSGAVPTLVGHEAAWSNVAMDAPDASVTLRSVELSSADVIAERFTAERGTLVDVVLRAESVELLGASLSRGHLDVAHLASAGGRWDGCTVARCDEGWLAGVMVVTSDFSACSAPLELRHAIVDQTVFRGALRASETTMTGGMIGGDILGTDFDLSGTVLRGATVDDEGGVLGGVSLCGTTALTAESLSCPHCEPAPLEVCVAGGLDTLAVGCPGLCRSSCRGESNRCQ